MYVEIRTLKNGDDHLVGALRLQGDKIIAEPDITLLRNILAEPVYDWRKKRVCEAESDPVGFLRTLHLQYKSAYLCASAPIENKPSEET